MNQTIVNLLNTIDQTTLEPLVRQILNHETAQIVDWIYTKIHGGGGDAYDTGQAGVYRFAGHAIVDGEHRPWQLICKVFDQATGQRDPTNLYYWEREPVFYAAHFLDRVPTQIVSPRYLGVARLDDGIIGVWLEDVADLLNGQWSLEHFGTVAQHFGQMHGALRISAGKPTLPWFSNGRIHQWLTMAAPQIERIPNLHEHPRFRRWLTPVLADRTLNLWARRTELLAIYARLPTTFCHHDAHRRNLFVRRDQHGRLQTVAIDWAFAGTGVVGEDIATLLAVDVQFGGTKAANLRQFDQVIFDGYLCGLAETRWQADPDLVRLGFTISAALTWALSTLWWMIPAAVDSEFQTMAEAILGKTVDSLVDEWAGLQTYLLDLADEALALAKRFP